MKRTIYFGDNSLTFINSVNFDITSSPAHSICLSEGELEQAKITEIFDKYKNVLVQSENIEKSVAQFSSNFKCVTAAGGVVEDAQGAILMIHRLGRWDLPKGHLEVGESLEQCALREVCEESGVGQLTLGAKLCTTQHIYSKKGVWELKTTHWWAMSSDFSGALTPQIEEGIDDVQWIPLEKLASATSNSFPTIRDVLAAFRS